MNASSEHLQKLYDVDSTTLEKWDPSPEEITQHDWTSYLGRKEYQRAFLDFFEDQNVEYGYHWKDMVHDILFTGPHPIFTSLTSGLGHPLIHLAYAFELESPWLATEALTLTATARTPDSLCKYMDDPKWSASERRPPSLPKPSTSLMEVISHLQKDKRLDNVLDPSLPVRESFDLVLDKAEDAFIEWWNSWDLSVDPSKTAEMPSLSERF